jgi:predicted DNA-binding protein (MmcQ/YjbR family)
MDIETLRNFCLSLPAVTEDIKWGDNLVFSVAGKMFCLADLEPPLRVSLKVPEEQFYDLTAREGIIQAPYFARKMWITLSGECLSGADEWSILLRQSYDLVVSKLPGKTRDALGANPIPRP